MINSRGSILESLHAKSKGLDAALSSLGMSLDDAVAASICERGVVACLVWHYSTSRLAPLSQDVSGELMQALVNYVETNGWAGLVFLCEDRQHVAVLDSDEGMQYEPTGCQAPSRYLYKLADLKGMAQSIS